MKGGRNMKRIDPVGRERVAEREKCRLFNFEYWL